MASLTERVTYAVPTTGVGRRDFSQDVQASVEPLIRSHQERFMWIGRYYLPTLAYGVDYWAAQLFFYDYSENEVIVPYCPTEPTYTIYDFQVNNALNALTECGLYKMDLSLNILETIFHVFGYGKAEATISRGYVCEPGYVYAVLVTAYSEEPWFFGTYNVGAMNDRLVEG